jgi:hypothetical protein
LRAFAPFRGICGDRGFSVNTSSGRTPVEKRFRSSHIVILTAVSCLLLACVVTSPVIFISAASRNGDPASEASILAERHLDRAMGEIRSTGNCSAEGRTICCGDGRGAVYDLDTRVERGPSGEASRVSVRVRWKGPLGGGAVVATGMLADGPESSQAAAGGGPQDGEIARGGPAGIREAR